MYAASETRFMRSPESDSQSVFAPRETHWHNTVGDSEMPVGKDLGYIEKDRDCYDGRVAF